MLKTEELKLVYRILNNCYIKLMMPRKQSCGFIKLPFRLHQFRFFLGEQSRVPFATIYGNSIFALFYKFIISRVLLTAGFCQKNYF